MNGRVIPPELASFLAEKTAAGLRPRSVEWYQQRIEPILADLGPLPSREAILAWLLAWRDRTQPAIAHYRGILLALRAYLHHHGVELGIPLPPTPRYEGERLSAEEVQRLLAAVEAGSRNRRDYAILALLLDTGLRASELTALVWADVDFTRKRLLVNGKGGHRRHAYFGETAKAALAQWRENHPADTEFVFSTKNARALTRGQVWVIVAQWGRKAHLKVHPHMLRRTFATQWVRAGGNVFALQRLLGHSTMDMVRRYVTLAETDLALANGQRGVLDGIL